MMKNPEYKTDLPVLLPVEIQPKNDAFRVKLWHGFAIFIFCLLVSNQVFADDTQTRASALSTLVKWMPLLLSGFIFNIIISFCAMALGTAIGTALGIGQISLIPAVKSSSWFVTQFFRNAPWLVLLFFAMFLLPFEFDLGFVVIPFPDWVKAIIGLSLPVMANVSEIVRGAIASIPTGQWEAAESLAYTRRQTLWLVVLPQCVKRMMPPWMNLYSILTMATVLASVVGVSEVMTLTGEALAAEGGRTDLLAPFYGFVLLIFFAYCYPIARYTVYLENKFAVKS